LPFGPIDARIALQAPRLGALLLLAVVLVGCAGLLQGRLEQAQDIGRRGGLSQRIVEAGGFRLLGFERTAPEAAARGGMLVIYMEGDGRAWIHPWQPASDPTPTDPVALRLAAKDPARPLLYLARPCQYLPAPGCAVALWTDERLSPAVVAAFQQAIDDAKQRSGAVRIGLVGYSGGGALAALLAERRDDAVWLVTVAANLDLAAWVRLHGVDPLTGSLDPAASVARIAALPQVHFVGGDDRIVPESVVASFVARLPATAPARLITVPGFDHECCWAEHWPDLLARAGLPR
jgi:hypothetical protein